MTENPIFLDFSSQGVTTRTVPWFLLGYLTVLQTTCNGTVHRGLARTVGILLGSLWGWVALKCCGSNLGGLIALCSATVFIDIFLFADPDHPLDGFHKRWGYSGAVFTYTQGLVVTLATEELGGLTGWYEVQYLTQRFSGRVASMLVLTDCHLVALLSLCTLGDALPFAW